MLRETVQSYDDGVSLDRWKISEIHTKNLGPITSAKETCWQTKLYAGSNIKTELKEIQPDSINWTELSQRTVQQHWSLMNTVTNFQLPQNKSDFVAS